MKPQPPACDEFGTLPDGRRVHWWTLTDETGLTARVLTYGAILQSLHAPDAEGRTANVALGYDKLDGYLARGPFFGATIGRFGNRITNGRFTLDGRTYQVPLSDTPRSNSLHGGEEGFDTKMWDAEPVADGVELKLVSADGDQGFPGTLHVTVRYTLAAGQLRIDYRATTDAPTVVNLTNHTYLNLAGEGTTTVLDHELRLAAHSYLPVDEQLIPLGDPAPVVGTPFDFTAPKPLGAHLHDPHDQLRIAGGYDHWWVLDGGRTKDPRPVAELIHARSGRTLTMSTTEPGIQVYTGNGAGVALETQHFPDTPNRPDFPTTELRPGAEYRSSTIYAFSRSSRPDRSG
jgi:aldose 1-epimerase